MKNKGEILVIDDTVASLRLLSRVLEEAGYSVGQAESGEQALSLAEGKPPELILLDVRMPGMSGFQVCERLKAKPATGEIPVVFLTASEDPEDSIAGLRLGAVDYISKPYSREGLLAKVSTHIELFRLREKLKQQALELSAERDRFSALFQNSNDAVFLHCMEPGGAPGKFIEVNDVACARLGYSREELLALTPADIAAPDMEEKRRAALETLLSSGRAVFEIYHSTKDGRSVPSEISSRVFDYGGKTHILSLARDITERKLAEKERERLLTAIEQGGEAIVITDTEAVIQYVNPSFERITGYGHREAVGKKLSLLKSGMQDEAFYRDLWGKIGSGQTWAGRMVNRRKDGTLYTEESTISPVRDPQGRIINYVAVKRDITEQLKLETRLRQSQRMETVGLLAGGVAHDFNNILSAIMCNAGFLARDLAPEDPKQKDVKEILAASERAASLTRQLLAFSRRQIMATRATDINWLMGGMVRMLGRVIGELVMLAVKLSPEPCTANVDPGQIEQVIMNLALNARDALAGGGVITLETELINPPAEVFDIHPDLPKGPLVCLKVGDTGCGMSEEIKTHLFEPFFTTKEQGKGTGLGLSTVFGIVKQSRGEITVESEPGKGSVFTVYLPFEEARSQDRDKEKEKAKEPPEEPLRKGHETVLLVEDEESLRRLGARILSSSGYTVLVAADGQAALKLMEERGKPVDLLMSDVVMPGMSGRELGLELARRKLIGRALYMSGYTDDAIVKHGVLEPGIAFIYKPFTVDAVLLKLREVLDGPADKAKA